MKETLQQDQQPDILTTVCGHPHTSSFMAFAKPGKICLIFMVSDFKPLKMTSLWTHRPDNR